MDNKTKKIVVYIHGKDGNVNESEHYKSLFPNDKVIGFDYQAENPWQAKEEFAKFFAVVADAFASIILIANSIGAFFVMSALQSNRIEKAYFISPIVNMEKLICDMMKRAGVTEKELLEKGEIKTDFGETLSWKYLLWVRENPILWNVPTSILYGSNDALQSIDTIEDFSDRIGASLTVMENGEHWFHTQEQMDFLDRWIAR